jgi:non-ribosomal peptide synthetase component E (peptide arylation enzyme)
MFYASPLIDSLTYLAEHHDEVPILVTQQGQIRASWLLRESEALAAGLYQQGFRENDLAVIAAPPGIDFLNIIYATIILRGWIAIIDPEMGRDNYRAKLRQLQPGRAFVDSRLLLLQEHPLLRQLYFRLKRNTPYFPHQPGIRNIAVGRWLPLIRRHLSFRKLLQQVPAEIRL